MAAKKAKKSAKKKPAAKKKAGSLVAKVEGLPKVRDGYMRFVQGNEIREVKRKEGGTKGAKRKSCKRKGK